ncbi:MAG: PAS domain S-box protein, partial [Proteobacteria bacterium]|nr:PAS domain S-box protein [Pseudomonadota bacterium]
DHVILEINPAVSTLTGLDKKDIIGKRCYHIFHCTDHPPEGCPHETLLISGRDQTIDMEMQAMGRTFMVTVAPILDEHKNIVKTIHLAKDITHRKNFEQELKRKNRTQTVLISCNQAVVRAKDEVQLIQELCSILVTDGGYRLAWVGYAMDNAEKTVKQIASCGVNDNYVETVNLVWSDTKRGQGPVGTAIRTKMPAVCRDIQTDPRLELWRADALKRGYGSLIALPLIIQDHCIGTLNLYSAEPDAFDKEETGLLVELAKDLAFGISTLRTQANLILSETKYRKLMETANDAIFLADAQTGILLETNKAAEKLLGRPMADIIGMHQTQLHPKEDRQQYRRIFADHIEKGNAVSEVFTVLRKDGSHVPVMVSANTFNIGEKKVVQGIFRDVSEIVQAEERLRQSQKMEAIGTLAGGIAHDFNNILAPIMGYTELAMIETNDQTILSDLSRVMEAAGRAKELFQQILTFSRKDTTEKKPHRIQQIIKETVKFLRASIPSSIDLQTDIDVDCDPVMCNQTQVQQILMNLGTNAYHAMKEKGGRLDIRLKQMEPDFLLAPDFNGLPLGRYVCLSIKDTGTGISPEDMERIFDPYFTTKNKEEGTGLGLSLVHGIVESYGGVIKVRSKKDVGTVFKVYLPVVPGLTKEKEKLTDTVTLKGSERILLVDDDRGVVQVTQKILENLGYQVTVMTDSKEALKIFSLKKETFDLVITDHTMPGLQGTDLARQMILIRPDIPIILCTGYSALISREKARQLGIKDFLMKPLAQKDLAAAIRKVLDERKEP